jgi:hypothetical protein
MYITNKCPCCDSTDLEKFGACIAPFVSAYVFDKSPAFTRLAECRNCRFRFFEERFSDEEAKTLYADYRGPAYFKARHRFEPWYTRRVNETTGCGAAEITERRALISKALRNVLDPASLRCVLDFGGDRGQFIPDDVGPDRTVFDISGVEPVAGVTGVRRRDALGGRSFDLVLFCHVLEHCSNPEEMLVDVKSLLNPAEGALYIEVPYERYKVSKALTRRGHQAYVERLLRHRFLLMLVDFFSVVFRMKLNRVPRWGLIKLHEHINFFDETSLRLLVEKVGLKVLSTSRAHAGLFDVLQCVAANG